MKIFVIGIGGIAMGNLAYMLKSIGHEVSGSDIELYPPMSEKLVEWGMNPKKGFDPIEVKGYDLVIIGNAISRGNPQVEEVLNSGLDYMSMPEAISHFFLKGKKVIVVAGTHGKTTTTFLIHFLLKEAGLNPGLFVGGIRKDGHAGFEVGSGEYFVIEGDEYDTSFFDKSSKFLHYRPYYLALTALDFDHADIFEDIESIKIMFKRLLNLVPSTGKIFYWEGSEHLKEIVDKFRHSSVQSYEINSLNSILSLKFGNLESRYLPSQEVSISLLGVHNYRNTEVALNICFQIAPDKKDFFVQALSKFPGVKRRQEILYQSNKYIVMEDFAHHPVAIRETIKAIRMAFPEYLLISLFEPRSATSHRNVFQKDFAKSFKGSKISIITEIFNINKVPEEIRLNVTKLVKKIPKKSGGVSYYCEKPSGILEILKELFPDLGNEKICILAMSNGSFGGIYPELINLVKENDK